MIKVAIALLALQVATGQKPLPIPAELQEAYAIYSAIYRNPPRWDRLEPGEVLAISGSSSGFLCGGHDYTVVRRTEAGWTIEGRMGGVLY
jgi:hypothetical protein